MERVYITGSGGFIGSELKKRFKGPICIPHDKIKDIKLQQYDRFYFVSTYGNMAWHDDDAEVFKSNITDLIKILTSPATRKGFKSFTFISSSSVKLENQTMYSRSKRAAEEILLAFMEKHKLPIQIIRPFSVTGVGEQKEHLIPKLINSAKTGELMNFVPEPAHDFIDIQDLIDGILTLSFKGARGVFDLGTGKQTTNKEVKDLVEKYTGKVNVNVVPSLRSYDTGKWATMNPRAMGYGWSPKKTLEQSIQEMVKHGI